jgi:raffinose/stachyose/melibiose transport system substrate-binding protein
MTNTLSKIVSTGLVLTMSLSLAACGGNGNMVKGASVSTPKPGDTEKPADTKGGDKGKLKVYVKYSDEDTKAPYDYAVGELKKTMPDVQLEMDIQAQDDGQKLKTYAATGDMPDIFQATLPQFQVLAKSNNIYVMDNDPEAAKFKGMMNPTAMGRLVAPDGHIYGFPFAGTEFLLLYYNKKIFQDAGIQVPIKTYDQLNEASKKLSAKGIVPLSIFAKEGWVSRGFYNGIASREVDKGVGAFDNASAKASDPAFKSAAEWIQKFAAAGMFPKNATNTNYDQAASLFYQGKAAMFVNGQWEIYSAQKQMGDNIDFMYWPAKDEATYEQKKFVLDGAFGSIPEGFGVAQNSKNRDLAVKVASFLAQKYAEYKYVKLGNPIVSIKIDKPVEGQVPAMMQRIVKETLPNIKGFAEPNTDPKIETVVNENTQTILVEGNSPDQFAKNIDKVINEINKK